MSPFLVLLVAVLILGYNYFTKYFDYFKKQGIKGPKPVPIFGTWWGIWNKQLHKLVLDRLAKYGRIYGAFDGRTPNLVISDPKLLRNILIKDFDHFTDRKDTLSNNKYLQANVGSLTGHKWKEVRSAMSPMFSSGKIKQMIEALKECARATTNHLDGEMKSTNNFNITTITVGYTFDVIISCVLGMKLKSLRSVDDPMLNQAVKVIQGEPSKMNSLLFILTYMYPQLGYLIPSSAFSDIDSFVEIAKKIVEEKKMNPGQHHDFVQLMLANMAENEGSPFKNEEVFFAQVQFFLLAGFDTPATALGVILHCLTMNEDVQDKLRMEIKDKLKENGGEITYEMLQELPYMEQVIAESLRLYPTNVKVDRLCNKTVTYDGIRIENGIIVSIPIWALHRDPEYYPNPEKFDPERFSQEEKAKRDPMTYLPFGGGPRGCMAMRFAYIELRVLLAHLISNYRLSPNKMTRDPPHVLDGYFTFSALVAPEMYVNVEKV